MVRLKELGRIVRIVRTKTFQFLNGAIKSIGPDLLKFVTDMFQFLNGAIKRCP